MRQSSIAKQTGRGPGSPLAIELGSEIRRRRQALGMTQRELGEPLTRGFVCLVEQGRSLPSLGALCLFAERLGTTVGELVEGVNGLATMAYTQEHERYHAPRPGRRPGAGSSDRDSPSRS